VNQWRTAPANDPETIGYPCRPQVTTIDQILTSRTQLTRPWLTAVPCREHPGASVGHFETAEVSSGTSTQERREPRCEEVGMGGSAGKAAG
jgi:hypothetical protein